MTTDLFQLILYASHLLKLLISCRNPTVHLFEVIYVYYHIICKQKSLDFFFSKLMLHHTIGKMFIAALFVIDRNWKQSRGPSKEEWIQKMWILSTMEFYSAINNEDIMSFAGKSMEVKNITLCEIIRNQKSFMVGTNFGYQAKITEYLGYNPKNLRSLTNRNVQ